MRELLAQAFEHHRSGRLAEADELYRQILAMDAGCANAWHLRGAIALATGRFAQAVDWITQAVKLSPEIAQFHTNLGIALTSLDRLDEALQSLVRAVQLDANDSGALFNMGTVLVRLKRPAEARRCFEQAIQLAPTAADFHEALGGVLQAEGNLAAAERCFRQAIAQQPTHRQAHCNLAILYRAQERWNEAAQACREIVRLDPNNFAAHRNLAAVLDEGQQYDEAVAVFEQLARAQPNDASTWAGLGVLRQKQGQLDAAFDAYAQAVRLNPSLRQNFLFALAHDPRKSPQEIVEAHVRWGQQYANWASGATHDNSPDPERPLRVGYVSGDFCRHAVVNFFEPLLTHHDPSQIRVVCFANVARPDRTTEYLKSRAPVWHAIYGMQDDEVVDLIRRERIDILVDLSGHTADNRLLVFARKPAPVQATYLGYPCTTGLTSIDYRISDSILDPPDEPTFGTETIMRLPGTAHCYAPLRKAPPVTPLPALLAGRITFGSLHKLTKINASVIDVWCRLLRTVPSAKLLLLRDNLKGDTRETLHRQFVAQGITAERLDFRSEFGPTHSHLAAYQEVDIALDTFPYAGGTTSNEAIWMGAPVLTVGGDRPAARAGAALMHFVGCPEFIADSHDDYVRRGVQLTADLAHLASVRSTLRDRFNASIGDCRGVARTLEDAYRRMWRTWCAAQTT